MKVVILAGGFGSRLSEETKLRPKPLIDICGKPLLWHIMKIYSFYGFNDFIARLLTFIGWVLSFRALKKKLGLSKAETAIIRSSIAESVLAPPGPSECQ